MLNYIIRRILISIPTLLGITIIVFIISSKMPGDAVSAMISTEIPAAEELMELRRGQLGLDLPLHVQYTKWIGQLLQGNLGYSFQTGESVNSIIYSRIGPTFQLMGVAIFFSILTGLILGTLSALKQYSIVDYSITLFGFIGVSVPEFFLAMVFVYIGSLQLGLFPSSGMQTAGVNYSLIDNLQHLFLPALALAASRVAIFIRYTRSSVLEVMNHDYVRTARSKGLKESAVIFKHVFRNALMPIITIIGIVLPVLFGGSIVIEMIFQWPGIGLMFINSITSRDSPVIMGYVLISASLVLILNLLTDLAYSVLDPRIRYE